jgi:hypothetical protein
MPYRLQRHVFPALALASTLTACGPTPAPVSGLPVADGLLTCQPFPVGHREQWRTDEDLWSWIQDVADAGQDCRDKLAAVAGVVAK